MIKKILVEIVGFGALIIAFKVYFILERNYGSLISIAILFLMLVPLSFIWRNFYLAARKDEGDH